MTVLESMRRSRGLSQEEIAKALKISRFWYWLIEKNKVEASEQVAERIEQYFKKSIKYLLKTTQKNKGEA